MVIQLGVDLDKAFAEAHVAPLIILLALHRRGNHGFNTHHRCQETSITRLQRLGSRTIKRALFVDKMAERERRWKHDQPIEVQFERIKSANDLSFLNAFVTMKHD